MTIKLTIIALAFIFVGVCVNSPALGQYDSVVNGIITFYEPIDTDEEFNEIRPHLSSVFLLAHYYLSTPLTLAVEHIYPTILDDEFNGDIANDMLDDLSTDMAIYCKRRPKTAAPLSPVENCGTSS